MSDKDELDLPYHHEMTSMPRIYKNSPVFIHLTIRRDLIFHLFAGRTQGQYKCMSETSAQSVSG